VERGKDGQFFYRHLSGAAFTLADTAASVTAGERVSLGRSERAFWKRLLLLRTGRCWTPELAVELPAPKLSEHQRRVLDGFLLALRVRRLTDPDTVEVPFAYRFAARLCGLSFDQVVPAIAALMKKGLLVRTRQLEGKGGYPGAWVYELAGLR